MQYLTVTSPTTGLNVRRGARNNAFVKDVELTPTGFSGTEGIDWENIDKKEFQGYQGPILLANTISLIENSVAHCCVVRFDTSWHGYKYWMVGTPFPSDNQENPSIWVSNNLTDWIVPPGLTNPVYAHAQYPKPADPCLVYDPNLDELIMYFQTNSDHEGRRGHSSDGIHWSAAAKRSGGENLFGSPSVIVLPNGKYEAWDKGAIINEQGTVYKLTSDDGITWNTKVACTYPKPRDIWHIEVKLIEGTYYMLTSETYGVATHGMELYFYTSPDGLTWTPITDYPVIDKHWYERDSVEEGFLFNKYYKSSFLPERGGKWTVIASEWYDYDTPWRQILFQNISLPLITCRPDKSLALVPTAPYIVGDNFDRADTAEVDGLGTSNSGHVWTNFNASTQRLKISNKVVIKDSNVYAGGAVIDTGLYDNLIIEARFNCDTDNYQGGSAVVFRYQNYLNFWSVGTDGGYGNANVLFIRRVNNGAQTGMGTAWSCKVGDIIGVKIEGDFITILLNGMEWNRIEDTAKTGVTATKQGIWLYNPGTYRGYCDYFMIRQI